MPPFRTLPPVKPVKTERTHAENQERAYIAASRRSDRSLEARVESARRASEIHKKRTGRSLRVTEADVINEEMYEEEDDDLPAQIRRITAHLHTGNDPFNRRLQAYLANHIAMRSALGQVVADNWQQQQMQNNNLSQYLNPVLMQQQQQNQNFAFQNTMLPPQTPSSRSPQMYRSSPYSTSMPSPQTGHVRSASIAAPQMAASQPSMSPTQQSMSAQSSPVETKHKDERRFSVPVEQQMKQTSARPGPLNLSDPMFSNPFGMGAGMSMAPLTATLPMEAQQLLAGAPASELNDPAMAAMMQTHLVPTPGGSFNSAADFYSYNPNGSKGKSASRPASTGSSDGAGNKSTMKANNMGMDTTLAPSMLDAVAPSAPFGSESANGAAFDGLFGTDFSMPQDGGQLTPGDNEWNMWIESQAFGDDSTTVS